MYMETCTHTSTNVHRHSDMITILDTYECPYERDSQRDQYKPNQTLLSYHKKRQIVLGYSSGILSFFFLIQWFLCVTVRHSEGHTSKCGPGPGGIYKLFIQAAQASQCLNTDVFACCGRELTGELWPQNGTVEIKEDYLEKRTLQLIGSPRQGTS